MAAVLYRHVGRPASAFIASTALRWWPPMFALRSFPLMATANPPIHRRFRFSHRPWSIVTVSRLQDNESDKPCRRLLTSPGKTIIVLQGAHHSTITQDMMNFNTDDSKEVEHIENKGAISLVDDEYEMQSEKDTCRKTLGVIFGKHGAATPPPTNSLNPKQVGVDSLLLKKYNEWGQDINLTSSEEDQRSATKDHMVDIAVSNEEEYIRETVIPESRHSDGSIYRDMDIWWKRDFRIADRNES